VWGTPPPRLHPCTFNTETRLRWEAFFPPCLQIILFGFLGIVLMQWAIDRQLGERRSLLLFVVFLGAAVFFGMRAVSLNDGSAHSEPVITKTKAHAWTPGVMTNLIEQHRCARCHIQDSDDSDNDGDHGNDVRALSYFAVQNSFPGPADRPRR
jgi:hypothetical protein